VQRDPGDAGDHEALSGGAVGADVRGVPGAAVMDYDAALSAQADRAQALVKDRRCSHCDGQISLIDALSMVRGHGFVYYIKILLRDGTVMAIEERDFSPVSMLWSNENER
jgi:hypothetical protein